MPKFIAWLIGSATFVAIMIGIIAGLPDNSTNREPTTPICATEIARDKVKVYGGRCEPGFSGFRIYKSPEVWYLFSSDGR